MQYIQLNSGYRMPILGLGTYLVQTKKMIDRMVETALECGYRAFDTAENYGNEHLLGKALEEYLPKFNLLRADIFITSKLDTSSQGIKSTQAILKSLEKLKTPYIDLYLIHFPGATGLDSSDPMNRDLRTQSWACMEELVAQGKLKSIGVSNYTPKHLEHLLSVCKIKPAVNQVEFNPHLYQKELLDYCNANGIQLEAYSSLGSQHSKKLMSEPVVRQIAEKYDKNVAQILLRWAIQHKIIVIPKSKEPERIKSNIQVFDFELDSNDMAKLDGLNQNIRLDWDPTNIV